MCNTLSKITVIAIAAAIAPQVSVAYELTPVCRPFFGTFPEQPILAEEMIKITYDLDRTRMGHVPYFSLFPPSYLRADIRVYDLDPVIPSKDLRLAFAWTMPAPPTGWPNGGATITYEILEDHFKDMGHKVQMTIFVGREFIWIESVADQEPNYVTTSPVFFGIDGSSYDQIEAFASAVHAYHGNMQNWANGAVTKVERCRYPALRRFEAVIDEDYARNNAPTVLFTNKHKAETISSIIIGSHD